MGRYSHLLSNWAGVGFSGPCTSREAHKDLVISRKKNAKGTRQMGAGRNIETQPEKVKRVEVTIETQKAYEVS